MKINEENTFIENYEGNIIESLYENKIIFDDHSRFVVSCWGRYSYFIYEKIEISEIEIVHDVFSLLEFSLSRFRSNIIGHNTYTGGSRNFTSKPIPLHVPVHKSDFFFVI